MNLNQVRINEGFWKNRKDINKNVSFYSVLKIFEDTGRVRALTKDLKDDEHHHIFWESDLAKLMESAFFMLNHQKDDKLIEITENIIDKIINNQEEDGYLNSYFSFYEPQNKFTNLRVRHELYCAGHLLESAVEHKKLNGESRFFDAMEKYVDHIITIFGKNPNQKRGYPGHQEIELALVKAYELTDNEKYLKLSNYFIEERGTLPHYYDEETRKLKEVEEKIDYSKFPSEVRDFIRWQDNNHNSGKKHDYVQAHDVPRKQYTAEGHSVRALYMFTAMADLARLNNDSDMLNTCKKLWRNIVDKRMYIHSGVGSAHHGERFSFDYDLTNDMAYAETCATIALIYFADRLSRIELNSEYSDIIENSIYNLILASTSIDGKGFFYDNYLECNPGFLQFQNRRHGIRDEYHTCSCCPPNVLILMGSLDIFIYSSYKDQLVVNQFISSELDISNNKQGLKIKQISKFPSEGNSIIEILESNDSNSSIFIRIPKWDKNMKVLINNEQFKYSVANGFAEINRKWKKEDKIELNFDFSPKLLRSNSNVRYNIRKACLFRGPILYCLEGVDNGDKLNQIIVNSDSKFEQKNEKIADLDIISLSTKASRIQSNDDLYSEEKPILKETEIKFIPYYTWSNRGENEMLVWINEK